MTGAKQIMQAQAVNNHNIANLSTIGFRADAVAAQPPGDHGVLQPGVHEAIPQHIDETSKVVAVPGHHPAEAVPAGQHDPVPLGLAADPGAEGLGVQRVDLVVGETATPLIDDAHAATIPTARRFDHLK